MSSLSPQQKYEKSKSTYSNVLESEGYSTIEHYIKNNIPILTKCPNGHEYKVSPNKFKSGRRCPQCLRPQAVVAKSRFISCVNEHGYKFPNPNSYISCSTKVELICPNDHTYNVNPTSFMNSGHRCPTCTSYGGYNQQSTGYFYLVRWTSPDGNHTFLKFGVSHDPVKRFKSQSRKTKYTHNMICRQYYDDGNGPLSIETLVHHHLKTGVISKVLFGDGFTETCNDTEYNMNYIKSLM